MKEITGGLHVLGQKGSLPRPPFFHCPEHGHMVHLTAKGAGRCSLLRAQEEQD